ncbi:MAG: ribonuclease P protein component [Clostridia bacterium]|nr:ribonuclease P protein component [Clostridia bacterium]
MQKIYRLSHNSSFQYIFRNGQKFHSDILILFATKAANLKLGVSVSKKVGNSVVRSKTKRRIKEAFRQLIPQTQKGYNFVVVAKEEITKVGYTEILQTLQNLLTKAGLTGDAQ